jgi:hypothetical protein
MTIAEVRRAALQLSILDRAALLPDLIASLPPDTELQISDEWLEELCSRSDAVHSGTAELNDWQAALQRIRSAMAMRRGSA